MTAILKPTYKLTLGATTVDSTAGRPGAPLVDFNVRASMDVPADHLSLVMGRVSDLDVPANAKVSLELGYTTGEFSKVFGGRVAALEESVEELHVEALSPMTRLLRLRLHQTYQNQTAGAIIKDLAGRAGLSVGDAQDGIAFPFYVVDEKKNAYQHVRELAEKCSFDIYLDAESKLIFKKFAGGIAVHTFEYGVNVIALNVENQEQVWQSVEVWGESPTSARGIDAAHWLTKTPQDFKGKAGSGEPLLRIRDRSIRTKAAAGTYAQARLRQIERQQVRGTLVVLGAPQVHLGDAIKIAGAPNPNIDGSYQVRWIHHRLNHKTGFVTNIGWISI